MLTLQIADRLDGDIAGRLHAQKETELHNEVTEHLVQARKRAKVALAALDRAHERQKLHQEDLRSLEWRTLMQERSKRLAVQAA